METKTLPNNPQVENGYTRIANEILENLYLINTSSYQTRMLLYLFRKTYGYGKKEDWISVSQISKALNMHKAHVSRTKRELLTRRLVSSNGNKIAFQKDSKLWRELPKQVTIKKVTNSGNTVASLGNKKLPVQADTKEIKETYTKENNTNVLQKAVYGNSEINDLITHLKETMQLPILDGSVQQNRNYANLCIKKFGGVDKVRLLIDAAKKHAFWSTKVTSFMKLYYNGVNIISSGRNQKGGVTKL